MPPECCRFPRPVRRASAVCVVIACCVLPSTARAQRDEVDGVYGRLDGDLVLSAELLGSVADTSSGTTGAASVALRGRYLDMTGVALGYDRALSSTRLDAAWAAVDFRPAWLARLTNDLEHGPRWLDLMLDSIGIELGAAWVRPGASSQSGAGLGFVLGGGFELPLVWSRGDGIMLRVGTRWITAAPWDALGTGPRATLFEAGLGLVFRTQVRSGRIPRFE